MTLQKDCETCTYREEHCAELYATFKASGLERPCGDYEKIGDSMKSKKYWLMEWLGKMCEKTNCDDFGCSKCRYDGNPLVRPEDLKP